MMDIAIIATDLALYFKLVFLFILRTRITITMTIIINTIDPIDLICSVCQAQVLCYETVILTAILGVRYSHSHCIHETLKSRGEDWLSKIQVTG